MEDRDDLKRILECVQQRLGGVRRRQRSRVVDRRLRALGRTDGATKVLLHRAIRQLEELVKKAEAGGA